MHDIDHCTAVGPCSTRNRTRNRFLVCVDHYTPTSSLTIDMRGEIGMSVVDASPGSGDLSSESMEW